MKRIWIVAFFLLASVWIPGAQAAGSRVIVFDLDGVVLFHPGPDTHPSQIVNGQTDTAAGGDVAASRNSYRVIDGFPEMLQSLIDRGYTVHVFSFGNRTRNESVLAGIHLPNGKTALTALRDNGGKVFSNEDGLNLDPNDTRTVIDTNLPRDKRPKIVKSLQKVLGEEAKNAILVEDMVSNADPKEKEGHLIHLPYRWAVEAHGEQPLREVKFLEDFARTGQHLHANGSAEELLQAGHRYDRLHGRMFYLAGLLSKAEDAARQNGTSVREEVMKLQWQRKPDGSLELHNGEPVVRQELLDDVALHDTGAKRLGVTRGLEHLPRRTACLFYQLGAHI